MEVITVKVTHSFYDFKENNVIIMLEMPMKYGYQQICISYSQNENDKAQLLYLAEILGAQRLVREFDKQKLRVVVTTNKDNKVIPLAFGHINNDKFFIYNGEKCEWMKLSKVIERLQ